MITVFKFFDDTVQEMILSRNWCILAEMSTEIKSEDQRKTLEIANPDPNQVMFRLSEQS